MTSGPLDRILQSAMDGTHEITPPISSPTGPKSHVRARRERSESPLRAFDTVAFTTRVRAEFGDRHFVAYENRANPRQLNFTAPSGLFDWFLVHVEAAGQKTYAHAYTTHGGILLNCFPGDASGPRRACGSHLLWWIGGARIDVVRRTVKQPVLSGTPRIASTVLTVRAAGAPVTIDVAIEALSNTNATRISDHAVDIAAWPRSIVPPPWPTGRGKHTITFDSA